MTTNPSVLQTLSPQEKLALEQRIVAALDFDDSTDDDNDDYNTEVNNNEAQRTRKMKRSPGNRQQSTTTGNYPPPSSENIPISSNSSIVFEIPHHDGEKHPHRPERSDSFLFGAYAGIGMVQVEDVNDNNDDDNEDRNHNINNNNVGNSITLHPNDTSFHTTDSSVNEQNESLTTPVKFNRPTVVSPGQAMTTTDDLSLSSLEIPSVSSTPNSDTKQEQKQLLQSSKKVAKYINKHYLKQLIHHQQQTLLHHNYPRLLLPVLERTPEPLSIEQWHLAVASVANDNLAIQHESANDRAAVVLVKGMAENNSTAKARITHERNTAALLYRSIPPPVPTKSTNSSKKSSTSSSLSPASSSSSSATPSKILKHTALSNSAARSVFSALCPTAAAEMDPVSVKADNAFETFMNRIGKDDPLQIHKLLRRHIFYCCRLHKGDPWLPSTASKETGALGGPLQTSHIGTATKNRSTAGSLSSSSAFVGSNTSSTLRNSQLSQKLSPGVNNLNNKSRIRTGSMDIDGIVRGTNNLTTRTAVDTVKDISRVVGNHSLGAKTSAFAELLRLMYADVLETAPKEEDTRHQYLSSDDENDENFQTKENNDSSMKTSSNVLVPRATVDAVITDIKNYTTLLAKGILIKYPFLTSLSVARSHLNDHSDLNSSGIGTTTNNSTNGPSRKDSITSTSSTSNMHTVDLSSAVLRCAQEAVYILVHETLSAIFAAHTVEPDSEAAEAFRYMRHQPPCVYGLSHAFCAEDEPGCTLHTSVDSNPLHGSMMKFSSNNDEKTPYGHAAALAEITYRAPIECLHILRKQRSPLTKLGALRTCLNAVTHGALVERAINAKQQQQSLTNKKPVFTTTTTNTSNNSIASPTKEDTAFTSSMLKVEISPSTTTNNLRNKNPQITPITLRTPSNHPTELSSSSSPIAVGPLSPVAIGADDLVPRLCFVVARARIYRFFSELAYLEECMPHDRSLGEDGYAVVTLRGAAMHVVYLAKTLKQTEEKLHTHNE